MTKLIITLLASTLLALPAAAKDALTVYTYDSFSGDYGPGKNIKAAFEKTAKTHLSPAVIIRIAHNKTGKQKEKIHGKITVVHCLAETVSGMCFKNMKDNHHNSRHTTQSIEYGVMGF